MPPAKQETDHSEEPVSSSVTMQEHEQRLQDMPPSAKLVAKILEEGEMSGYTIAEESLLPKRTVRYALRRLEDQNVTTSRNCLDDPRIQLYRLRD